MGVTGWLSKKDKKEGEIIRQNLKKRDRIRFMKKGWGVLPLCQNKSQKKIEKAYILNSFKLLRKRLETCNQIHKNIRT